MSISLMERLNRLPTTPLRRFAGWLIIANLLVDGAILGAVWQNVALSRAAGQRLTESAAQNLAHSLSHDLASDLSVLDRALADVATQARAPGEATDAARLDASRTTAARLGAILGPDLGALRLVALDGGAVRAADGSRVPDLPRPLLNRMLAAEGMQFSGPLELAGPGRWALVLSRRIDDRRGLPVGAVFAQVPIEYFLSSPRMLDLGVDGAVSVRGPDLRLIARYAPRDASTSLGIGSSTVSDALRRQVEKAPEQGTFRATTALDRVERINAYRRVAPYPLLVVAGVGAQEALATTKEELWRDLGIALAVMVAMGALSLHLFRAHRAERQARDIAARVAREQDLLLRNELVGMSRVRHRLTTWNNSALERMFGYAPGELMHTPTRLLYLDDESWQEIGTTGYEALREGRRFRTQLRMRRKDGRPLWVDLSGTSVGDGESLWMLVDIDALKRSEEDAQHLSRCDALTGLPNRRGLRAWFSEARERPSRPASLAVAYLDLDGFKPVNDALGHDAGDEVLRVVGARLSSALRDGDLAVRLGGDEFVLTLTSVSDESDARQVLERLRQSIRGPIRLESGGTVSVDASVGLAMGGPGDALDELMHRADEALYAAKRAGKGQVSVWRVATRRPDA
ncbi:MAG: diguanylate cyclase [Mitsuaria chitosanitabida]|uniref:diguanylate cyclase domain-containing protein n=1 Tax=Roseateles chitosanitabidus TaxID=65048 RepID=UPI001AFD3738|nr:diguanylate cyclase [Roseateles chitosanitabidus]MBO9685677.1 diguanylate cyclase [Roseateles chitosanitabidus]